MNNSERSMTNRRVHHCFSNDQVNCSVGDRPCRRPLLRHGLYGLDKQGRITRGQTAPTTLYIRWEESLFCPIVKLGLILSKRQIMSRLPRPNFVVDKQRHESAVWRHWDQCRPTPGRRMRIEPRLIVASALDRPIGVPGDLVSIGHLNTCESWVVRIAIHSQPERDQAVILSRAIHALNRGSITLIPQDQSKPHVRRLVPDANTAANKGSELVPAAAMMIGP
jgi:hypothetical protein